MTSGNITVDDEIAQLQRTTQAAISEAFKTPAVIKMFANKEPELLRERLNQIDRDIKLGKTSNVGDKVRKKERFSFRWCAK
jgi:hypothetical protein